MRFPCTPHTSLPAANIRGPGTIAAQPAPGQRLCGDDKSKVSKAKAGTLLPRGPDTCFQDLTFSGFAAVVVVGEFSRLLRCDHLVSHARVSSIVIGRAKRYPCT